MFYLEYRDISRKRIEYLVPQIWSSRMMKFKCLMAGFSFAIMLLMLCVGNVQAQCGNSVLCGESILSVDPCASVASTYVVESVAVAPMSVYSVTSCGQSNPTNDFNIGCAVQGVTAFTQCRQSGGGLLGCAAEGFGTYLNCNGGLIAQRRSARRSKRANRLQSRSKLRQQSLSGC